MTEREQLLERDYEVKNRTRDLAELVADKLAERQIPAVWAHRAPQKSGGDSSLYTMGVLIKVYRTRGTISVYGRNEKDLDDIEQYLSDLNLERIYPELLKNDGGRTA